MRRALQPLLFIPMLLVASWRPVDAQTEIEIFPRAASLTVGGRLHTQLQMSSVDGAATDVAFRRARIRVDIEISDFLDVRLNPDFAGGETELKDAWARLDFGDAFRLSMGQFKRAFSIFELSSSTDLPIVERDGRIEGLSACPGVGGACSFSRLTEKLRFDGRDQGLRVDGAAWDGRFSWLATLTNGEGSNTGDVNDAKSISWRVTWQTGSVRVGAFGAVQDHEVPLEIGGTDTDWAEAGGVDVEVGTWRDGLHLIGAAVVGDNWLAGPGVDFTTVQLLGSHYTSLGGARIEGIEPLFRASWTDTGTASEDAGGLLLTPGVMLYFAGKNGVSFNMDTYTPRGAGDTEVSFKIQTYLYF
ncbi:MAG: porin [Gemmatimonadota bacterium]